MSIATAFAIWFITGGLSPADPSVCELKGVYPAGRTGHFWGCYSCYVPEYKYASYRIEAHRYLGRLLMSCDRKWCKAIRVLPKWSQETAGTCEIEAQKRGK